MIEYQDYKWKENKLFLGKKDTGMSYVSYSDYPNMWQIRWKGTPPSFSENFYNLERVKDNMKKYHQSLCNRGEEASRKLADAFK